MSTARPLMSGRARSLATPLSFQGSRTLVKCRLIVAVLLAWQLPSLEQPGSFYKLLIIE
jgi:hypothetical protein